MRKEFDSWYSPSLNKHMDIVSYGHYGFALLLIPTAAADYLEYERFLMIDVLEPYINMGKVKVFSINSINSESWLNKHMHPRHKAIRHAQFNRYVENEVVPYIKTKTSWETPIIASGASFGALHASNLFFRRPDLFDGFIAMSGVYDLQVYTDGYWDEDVYFNSPVHYMERMNDHGLLEAMRRRQHAYILTGQGDYERPEASRRLSGILHAKGVPHELDVWGYDMKHDWPTWRAMLPHYVDTRF